MNRSPMLALIICICVLSLNFSNPNEGEFTSPLTWEPSTPDRPKYLEIDDNPKMGSVLFPHRYDIWESLFPIEDDCKSLNL